MRHLAKSVLFGTAALLVSTLAQAQPPRVGGTIAIQPGTVGEAMRANTHSGINWDDRNFPDPICGVTIIWPRSTPPYSFYNADRNPFGPPSMIPIPPPPASPVIWILQFGGPGGPCFSRSNPIFYKDHDTSKEFLGLHFGFYTDVKFGELVNFPYWWIGQNGQTNPGTGITGYNLGGGRVLHVANAAATAFAVRNAAVAVSDGPVPVNDLHRLQLSELAWQPLELTDDILPAAEGDRPGTLALEMPAEVLQQKGFAVFSYDIVDPETDEVVSNVTFEIAIPEK